MLPGLSGLLPRYIAASQCEEPTHLIGYVGGLDRMTEIAAIDYIASLNDGRRGVLPSKQDFIRRRYQESEFLRFFPGAPTARYYVGFETERLMRDLNLNDVQWHNVFAGTHLLAALSQLPLVDLDRDDAAARELARAAELDMFGQTPYQQMVFRLDGARSGRLQSRTLVLRGRSASELTGTVVAIATATLLSNGLSPGLHFAGEALSPAAVVKDLCNAPAVVAFDMRETTAGVETASL